MDAKEYIYETLYENDNNHSELILSKSLDDFEQDFRKFQEAPVVNIQDCEMRMRTFSIESEQDSMSTSNPDRFSNNIFFDSQLQPQSQPQSQSQPHKTIQHLGFHVEGNFI